MHTRTHARAPFPLVRLFELLLEIKPESICYIRELSDINYKDGELNGVC